MWTQCVMECRTLCITEEVKLSEISCQRKYTKLTGISMPTSRLPKIYLVNTFKHVTAAEGHYTVKSNLKKFEHVWGGGARAMTLYRGIAR